MHDVEGGSVVMIGGVGGGIVFLGSASIHDLPMGVGIYGRRAGGASCELLSVIGAEGRVIGI